MIFAIASRYACDIDSKTQLHFPNFSLSMTAHRRIFKSVFILKLIISQRVIF